MTKGKVAERERGKDDKTEEEGSKVNGRSLPFFFFLHLPRPLLIYYVVSQEPSPESRHVSFYFTWPFIFLSIFFFLFTVENIHAVLQFGFFVISGHWETHDKKKTNKNLVLWNIFPPSVLSFIIVVSTSTY